MCSFVVNINNVTILKKTMHKLSKLVRHIWLRTGWNPRPLLDHCQRRDTVVQSLRPSFLSTKIGTVTLPKMINAESFNSVFTC